MPLSRRFILPMLVALLAIAAGCGGDGSDGGSDTQGLNAENVPPNAVAVVAGTPILRTDFERFFDQAEKAAQAQGREFPDAGTPDYVLLQNQAVDLLIERVELAEEAEALGIEVTDAEVTERLDELKQQYYEGDEQQYQDELEAFGLTDENVRADIRDQLISEKIFDEVTADVSVTDADVQAYYDEHQDEFTTADSREVAHILVDTKKKAQEIFGQLQDGADFAKLAKEFSTDTGSAENGGRLTDEKGTFVPEFEEVAFSLETGEIGEPVKSEFGWHVIKALEDTVEGGVTPFDEVKDSIEEQLLTDRRNEGMASWLRDVRAKYEGQVAYAVGFGPLPETSTSTTSTAATPTGTTGGG